MKKIYLLLLIFCAALSIQSCKNCAQCSRGERYLDNLEKEKLCEKDFSTKEEYKEAMYALTDSNWICIDGPDKL